MSAIIIKVAFLYVSMNRSMVGNRVVVPTYRISMQVYPRVKLPKASIALSELDRQGDPRPVFLMKATEDELTLRAKTTSPK